MDLMRREDDHSCVRGVGREIVVDGRTVRYAIPVPAHVPDEDAVGWARVWLDAWEASMRARK